MKSPTSKTRVYSHHHKRTINLKKLSHQELRQEVLAWRNFSEELLTLCVERGGYYSAYLKAQRQANLCFELLKLSKINSSQA